MVLCLRHGFRLEGVELWTTVRRLGNQKPPEHNGGQWPIGILAIACHDPQSTENYQPSNAHTLTMT